MGNKIRNKIKLGTILGLVKLANRDGEEQRKGSAIQFRIAGYFCVYGIHAGAPGLENKSHNPQSIYIYIYTQTTYMRQCRSSNWAINAWSCDLVLLAFAYIDLFLITISRDSLVCEVRVG